MRKKLLRSVLGTAFVATLALGAVSASDVGWGSAQHSPSAHVVQNTHVTAGDVGWDTTTTHVSAAQALDVGW